MAKDVTIRDVEILKVGEWNGVPFSKRDLEEIAESFAALEDQVVASLRLGHDARQALAKALGLTKAAADDEGAWPAMGWVSNVRVKGERLLADYEGVPAKLADWIKARRYRTRSVGLRYNKRVGETVYRWVLDHVALLGADTPAVSGLADIGLSADDVDRLVEVVLAAESGEEETSLGQFMTALRSLFDDHAPLIYGRKGAPRVRQLLAALEADLRRVARAELPKQEKRMTRLNDLLGVLELAEDAEATEVVEALNRLESAERVVELMEGMAFETPEQLTGWLAGALGVAPGDLAGLAARIVEMMGGAVEAPMPDGEDEDAEGLPDETAMSEDAQPVTLTSRERELEERVVTMSARLAKLETERQRAEAEARVAADEQRLRISLPAPVRETLVELAERGEDRHYQTVIENVRGVPTDETGTSEDTTPVTLSEDLEATARRMGIDPSIVLEQIKRERG